MSTDDHANVAFTPVITPPPSSKEAEDRASTVGGKPPVRAALVDDSSEDRRIADRLTAEGLPCVPIEPGNSLARVSHFSGWLGSDGGMTLAPG
jgi:hypothetical protein